MPRKNGTKGVGHGSTGHGRPMGHGAGNKHERQDGEIGQHQDATPESADHGEHERGRSESSPGHLKKAAGAESAREYAPGRIGRADSSGDEDAPGRSRIATILSELAPDELGER